MSIDKKTEVRLFGFRINRTGTIILSFISLTMCIQFIPELYYSGQSLVSLFIYYSTPEILIYIKNLIESIIGFIIPLTIVSLFVAVFILCATLQKSFRNEDTSVRWLLFRLTKSSLAVLFILSLVYIIINSFRVYNYANFFIEIVPYAPIPLIVFYILNILAVIILLGIHIYTLTVCIKNREFLK